MCEVWCLVSCTASWSLWLPPSTPSMITGPWETTQPFYSAIFSGISWASYSTKKKNCLESLINQFTHLIKVVWLVVFPMLTCRTHGDLVSGLYHQILLSLQKVLSDPVRPLCSHYGAVVGLHALGWKVNRRQHNTHKYTSYSYMSCCLCVCVCVFATGCWTCAVSSPPCLLGEFTSGVRWLLRV